jgi:AraC family transcriptional regulator
LARFEQATDLSAYDPRPVISDLAIRMSTPNICAQVIEFQRTEPTFGELVSEKCHYIDWRYGTPEEPSRGCFDGWSKEYEAIGEILFVPAGYKLKALGGKGAHKMLNVLLPARPLFEDENVDPNAFARVLRNCLHLNNTAIRASLSSIRNELESPSFASELMIESSGIAIFVNIARILQEQLATSVIKGGLAPWRIKLIESRLHEGDILPSLAELAEMCGLSRRQLMRAFRQQTGLTVGSFVQQFAIERAKQLLIEDDRPIGLLAYQSGFSSSATFSVAFRRATGMAPSVYRSRIRSQKAQSPKDCRVN